jgi:hypothetical protein
MPEQQLHGAKVLGPAVDQRSLGAAQRVSAVRRRIKPDFADPATNDAGVLSRRQMG